MKSTPLVTSLAVALLLPLAAASASATPTHSPEQSRSISPSSGKALVIAHRGASGYRPEHTLAAYELAVGMGADYIEPDLVMTKDGVLVDRHEPEISGTTDVASHPEFAARKTTKQVDGTPVTGWFTDDFTLAELRTLRAVERIPELRQENTIYNGLWQVPTFEEVLKLRAELSRKHGREIGIIPEIKHSTYWHDLGLNPEAALVKLVSKYGLNNPAAPLWVQSFEWSNLEELRLGLKYKANLVFLISPSGRPYDFTRAGDPRTYADLLTDASLKELAQVVDGISPEKSLIIPRNSDGTLGQPTDLVARAHAAELQVATWTFRAENNFLPVDYRTGSNPADYGRIIDEVQAFLRTGLDSLFCDQPDICVAARDTMEP